MLVGEVDDGLGVDGAVAETVEVVEVSAPHPGARLGELEGGGVRAGEAGDLVAGAEQLVDDGRADPAGRSGDEHVHGAAPSSVNSLRVRS